MTNSKIKIPRITASNVSSTARCSSSNALYVCMPTTTAAAPMTQRMKFVNAFDSEIFFAKFYHDNNMNPEIILIYDIFSIQKSIQIGLQAEVKTG